MVTFSNDSAGPAPAPLCAGSGPALTGGVHGGTAAAPDAAPRQPGSIGHAGSAAIGLGANDGVAGTGPSRSASLRDSRERAHGYGERYASERTAPDRYVPERVGMNDNFGGGSGQPSADSLARMIEGEIIPRLLLSHRSAPLPAADDNAEVPAGAAMRAFAMEAVSQNVDALLARIDSMVQAGVHVERIYLDLLAPAARYLGAQWDEDWLSFADVSVALCRLRQVFEVLRSRTVAFDSERRPGRSILLAPTPGEQHTFGLAVVEHLFHDAGWHTHCEPSATVASLLAAVRAEAYDAIGLTISCDMLLDLLPALVISIRRMSRNPDISVIIGGTLVAKRPEIGAVIGADAVLSDARRAVEQAEAMVRRIPCRA